MNTTMIVSMKRFLMKKTKKSTFELLFRLPVHLEGDGDLKYRAENRNYSIWEKASKLSA